MEHVYSPGNQDDNQSSDSESHVSSQSSRNSSHPTSSITDEEEDNPLSKLLRLVNLRSLQKAQTKEIDGASRSSSINEDTFQDIELEKLLDQYHLELLLARFNPKQKIEPGEEKKAVVTYMDMRSFRRTIVELFTDGLHHNNEKMLAKNADVFFKKVDWQNNGKIMWDDICSYLLMDIKDEFRKHDEVFLCEPRIIQFHGIKDTMVKLMPDGNSSRFIQLTRNGYINILSSNFQIKKSCMVDGVAEANRSRNLKSKVWVTDSVCISNINKLFITTADRDLQVYDMSSPHFSQVFSLYDMPNAAMCMHYHYIKCHPYGKCYLFLGTDSGDIQFLTFLQPSKSLFAVPFKKNSSSCKVLYFDLHNHSKYVSHRCISHMHSDWVRRIHYVPEGDMLFSCSTNSQDSLIYQQLHKTGRKIYNFKVMKGVDCFDYSKELNLIATGSVDHVVRLWDPYSTARPMAILKFHESAILDLIIYALACQVFSFSKDGHICCWDTKEYACLQKIPIKFPLIGRASFDPGTRSIYMFDSLMKLIITGEHCIAELDLSTDSSRKALPQVAHDREVVAALCNSQKEQVISVSESGEIIRWSVTTGKKIFTIQEPKITGEVSAIAIDNSGEYLVTGSRNGSGALWNLTTAMCEKQLEPYSDEEITCVLILPGTKTVFMFGWSRKILAYYDSAVTSSLKPDKRWLRLHPHQDDIMSAVYWAPHFICTSCFDGSIHIWQTECRRLWKIIQRGCPTNFQIKILDPRLLRNTSRSSRKSARRKSPSLRNVSNDMSGVDILLFLDKRNNDIEAPLVAIEGNMVNFWSTLDIGKPLASFVVGSKNDSFITAVAIDAENKYLLTAENYGCIFVWEINGYASTRKVASKKLRKISAYVNYSTCHDTPPLLASWRAHNDEITSVSCINCNNNLYVVSASIDCRVKLWSIEGVFVGKFSPESTWCLAKDNIITLTCKKQIPAKRTCESADSCISNVKRASLSEDVRELEREQENSFHSSIPILPPIPGIRGDVVDAIPITADAGRIKSSDSYKARSKRMEDLIKDKKDSWGSLGSLYKKEVNRRMMGRANRRLLLSEAEERLLGADDIGVSCLCLPFKALITYETEEYIMPANPLKNSRMPANPTNT